MDVSQAIQELQAEVSRLRQREAELTNQVASMSTGPAASAGPGEALLQLARSQKELVEALRTREQVRLVDNKGLGKPDKFDGDPQKFLPWRIKTTAYLTSVRKPLREVLQWAEESDNPCTSAAIDAAFGHVDRIEGIEDMRKELWDALLMLTEKEPFDIVLNSNDCGIEGWRRLTRRYDPSTGGRKRALLNATLSPSRSKMDELPANLEKLLDTIRLYEQRKDAAGNRTLLAEDIKVNVIERLVPQELERHLVLNRDRFKTFDSMLVEIQPYVEHTTGNKIKVHNSQPYDSHGRPDDPMDVGSFSTGKAKGKGKKGKGSGGKTGKGNAGGAEKRTCHNCGKPGHLRADCRAPGGGKHVPHGGKEGGGSFQAHGKGDGRQTQAKGKPKGKKGGKGGKGVNNVEMQGEPEAEENWDAADVDHSEQAAYGLTLYALEEDENQVDWDPTESDESTGSNGPLQLLQPEEVTEHESTTSKSAPRMASPRTPLPRRRRLPSTPPAPKKEPRSGAASGSPVRSLDHDIAPSAEVRPIATSPAVVQLVPGPGPVAWKPPEPKGPPPPRPKSSATSSGSVMVQMLKSALSAQMLSEQDPSQSTLKALQERGPRVPTITKANINDSSFHDSRYQADIAKGTPHHVAWRDERMRRRAFLHRKSGVKERAAERIRLDQEWHERFDNPEAPEGVERIHDEDHLDAGIETVVVGKAGGSSVTTLGKDELLDMRQFPKDERKLLQKDPKRKPKVSRVRTAEYKKRKNRARNASRKAGPGASKKRPVDDDEIEDWSSPGPPDERRDPPASGGPSGGSGGSSAAVYSLDAEFNNTEYEQWEHTEMNIDTGAAVTAVPLDFAKDYPRSESNGASYKAANAESIHDEGSISLSGYDKAGNEIPLECRVANIHRPLLAGSDVAKRYHIALGPSSGRLIPRNTPAGRAYAKAMTDLIKIYGDSMPIVHNRRGIYVLDCWVPPFGGQPNGA